MNPFFGLLEIGLNRYLSLEPAAARACARLQDRVLAFSLDDFGVNLFLVPDSNGVRVTGEAPGEPDVRMTGGVAAFMRLLAAGRSERQAELATGHVTVEGDAALADQFMQLLESVRPDLEELIAPAAGEVMAEPIARLGRGIIGWGRHSASTLAADVAEYLREESGDLVHRADVERWMSRVDHLAEDADRLLARTQRLENRGDETSA